MRNCLFEFIKISKKFPPQKNENKFIYGKLGEFVILNILHELNISNIIDLDKKHIKGSEYKNDIQIDKIKFSIKTKLNKPGDVIMINCKSRNDHKIDCNTIITIINEKKLYIIPKSMELDEYIKKDSGSILFKSKLFTFINKEHKELIYIFPDITEEQKIIIDNICEVDIYNILYDIHIKS